MKMLNIYVYCAHMLCIHVYCIHHRNGIKDWYNPPEEYSEQWKCSQNIICFAGGNHRMMGIVLIMCLCSVSGRVSSWFSNSRLLNYQARMFTSLHRKAVDEKGSKPFFIIVIMDKSLEEYIVIFFLKITHNSQFHVVIDYKWSSKIIINVTILWYLP